MTTTPIEGPPAEPATADDYLLAAAQALADDAGSADPTPMDALGRAQIHTQIALVLQLAELTEAIEEAKHDVSKALGNIGHELSKVARNVGR